MFFLPTFAPVGDTRQRPEGFWLILNHLRFFYCYERNIDACGAAGRGLRCAESEERERTAHEMQHRAAGDGRKV